MLIISRNLLAQEQHKIELKLIQKTRICENPQAPVYIVYVINSFCSLAPLKWAPEYFLVIFFL